MTKSSSRKQRLLLIHAFVLLLFFGAIAQAQSFNSGSDGSDGALNLTTAGTYTFDPNDTATFGRVLDADGDGIYNFTSITIGTGVTLKFTAAKTNRPIYWLSVGAVRIDGILDLSGQNSPGVSLSLDQRRRVTVPGPGGYAGGAGGNATLAAQAGRGPGGGAAGTGNSADTAGQGGTFSGNRFLVPLVGGSGGGGTPMINCGGIFGASGGAGGGAIAIISSLSIALTGTIRAKGGDSVQGCLPGGGSGGGVRLAAVTVTGSGAIDVNGGVGCCGSIYPGYASPGQARVEAFTNQTNFNVQPNTQLSLGTPFNAFVPTSNVRVIRVNGVALPASPTGSFSLPDATINQTAAVTLDIEAHNIPVGTVVKLEIFSENPADNTVVNQVVDTTPLSGTTASSTASASVSFPSGFSRCFVRATWTQ